MTPDYLAAAERLTDSLTARAAPDDADSQLAAVILATRYASAALADASDLDEFTNAGFPERLARIVVRLREKLAEIAKALDADRWTLTVSATGISVALSFPVS